MCLSAQLTGKTKSSGDVVGLIEVQIVLMLCYVVHIKQGCVTRENPLAAGG